MKHLIDTKELSHSQITTLLELAQHIRSQNKIYQYGQAIIAHLFFENSTRTLNSFLIASHRLGAFSITPHISQTSLSKGESILDTIHTLHAMKINYFVIRHAQANLIPHLIPKLAPHIHIINAGSGMDQHPTQTLLDIYTMQQHGKLNNDTKISIIGDIRHSRVINSLLPTLNTLGIHKITLIAPKELLPNHIDSHTIQITDNLGMGLKDTDVIICLRIQRERFTHLQHFDEQKFIDKFSLDSQSLRYAKPDAIVMHPGPINRNCEISAEVADGPQSVILDQVENGIWVRMAILKTFFDKNQ